MRSRQMRPLCQRFVKIDPLGYPRRSDPPTVPRPLLVAWYRRRQTERSLDDVCIDLLRRIRVVAA